MVTCPAREALLARIILFPNRQSWADAVLLDNMTPDQLRAAVALVNGRAMTEASGGITAATVPAIAASGVDFISSGAITHSAACLDLGLDFDQIVDP